MALTVVAAYDVSEDGRRAHLAALLQSYGDRIQKSVFVLMVDDGDFDELKGLATKLIDTDTDSLWFIRQCGICWPAADTIGQAKAPEKVLYWAAM